MNLQWTIVLPAPRYDQRVWEAQVDLYKQWRIEYEAAHPAPPIENIRFVRDPHWRRNVLSIQAAHKALSMDPTAHPFWLTVSFLFQFSIMAFALGTFVMATMGWRF